MSKILVVYYSRSGTAQAVSIELAKELGADVEVISEKRSRKGFFGFMRSGYEATTEKSACIGASVRNPALYDVVVIGGPTWNGSLSSPVRAYLERHQGFCKRLAFFRTCGGDGEDRVFAQMAEEAGKQPIATLTARQADVESGAAKPAIIAFAKQVRGLVTPLVPRISERPPLAASLN